MIVWISNSELSHHHSPPPPLQTPKIQPLKTAATTNSFLCCGNAVTSETPCMNASRHSMLAAVSIRIVSLNTQRRSRFRAPHSVHSSLFYAQWSWTMALLPFVLPAAVRQRLTLSVKRLISFACEKKIASACGRRSLRRSSS